MVVSVWSAPMAERRHRRVGRLSAPSWYLRTDPRFGRYCMPLWFLAWGTVSQGTCKPIYNTSDLQPPPTRHTCRPRRSLGVSRRRTRTRSNTAYEAPAPCWGVRARRPHPPLTIEVAPGAAAGTCMRSAPTRAASASATGSTRQPSIIFLLMRPRALARFIDGCEKKGRFDDRLRRGGDLV